MNTFENTVKLRGFLVENARVPPSDGITEDVFAVLFLATMSGTWNIVTNEWTPRITRHRIVCPGPFFCGQTRGMRRGDYVEVVGELRNQDQLRTVVVAGESHSVSKTSYAVHATRIQSLDRPDALVDLGEDG